MFSSKIILWFAIAVLVIKFAFFSLPVYFSLATATVTSATGGSAISADTTGGAYTALIGPVIAEGVTADIGVGTIILNAPSGFVFDTGGVAPTVLLTRTGGTGANSKNINNAASGASLAITGITTTQITFTITAASFSGVTNSLTWQNVRVRPSAGTPLASGNITKSGTSAINGITNGMTNLGTLTETVGAKSQVVITTEPVSSVMVATDFAIKPVVAVRDQFGNTITSDNTTVIARVAVLSSAACGGIAGSGTLASTPTSGAAVSSGVISYTAMQYSVAESIKVCFTSSGITSALSNTITVSALPDTTLPATVSDLAAGSPSNSAITLSWTAPGDDGSTGTATSYDIRYSTSNITEGNWSSATQVSGEPSPLAAGTSQSMTVTGLSPSTTYYFAIKTSDEVPNTSAISNVPSLATTAAGGGETPALSTGGAGGSVFPTRVVVSGQAYPGATLELLRKSIQDELYKNIPEATSSVSADGAFFIQLRALLLGQYLFALRIADKDGRKTGIITFNVDLTSANELVAQDIFIPPTIDFEKSTVSLGKEMKALGYAAPQSTVEIEIDGILKGETISDTSGLWSYATSTAPFRIGNHYMRVKQTSTSGKESEFSPSRTFRVSLLVSPKSDLNNDDKITIADWSIFLFRWGSKDTALREKIDMNDDGKIDISDLSIFLKTLKTL